MICKGTSNIALNWDRSDIYSLLRTPWAVSSKSGVVISLSYTHMYIANGFTCYRDKLSKFP